MSGLCTLSVYLHCPLNLGVHVIGRGYANADFADFTIGGRSWQIPPRPRSERKRNKNMKKAQTQTRPKGGRRKKPVRSGGLDVV